jgi:hypothetical protein
MPVYLSTQSWLTSVPAGLLLIVFVVLILGPAFYVDFKKGQK